MNCRIFRSAKEILVRKRQIILLTLVRLLPTMRRTGKRCSICTFYIFQYHLPKWKNLTNSYFTCADYSVPLHESGVLTTELNQLPTDYLKRNPFNHYVPSPKGMFLFCMQSKLKTNEITPFSNPVSDQVNFRFIFHHLIVITAWWK
jgi:hypothetical protein